MSREVSESYHGPHLIFTLTDGIGCYSNVGRTGSNGQLINLGSSDCLQKGIIIHETLHALGTVCDLYILRLFSHLQSPGAVHEHSRPDRDLYVSILYDNVEPKSKANFRKVDLSSHNSRNTPFDAASIMMYGPNDFGLMDSRGRRKTTIKPLQPGIELRL